MYRKAVLALALTTLPSGAIAENSCLDQFAGKSVTWRLECLYKQAQTKAAGLPSGTVVAMIQDCPASLGWSRYKEGFGRVIVGAVPNGLGRDQIDNPTFDDVSHYRPEEKGGEEKVKLLEIHIPQHNHGGRTRGNHIAVWSKQDGGNRFGGGDTLPIRADQEHNHEIPSFGGDSTGETKKHENMPPYIALHWCIKN